MKVAIWHGEHIAFWYEAKPLALGTAAILSREAENPDGSDPVAGSRIVCGTCEKPFDWHTALTEAREALCSRLQFASAAEFRGIVEKRGDDGRPEERERPPAAG